MLLNEIISTANIGEASDNKMSLQTRDSIIACDKAQTWLSFFHCPFVFSIVYGFLSSDDLLKMRLNLLTGSVIVF